MARFLMLRRANPAAQSIMPTDPSTVFKMHEQWFAALEDIIKKGEIEEFGFFPETREGGGAGYAICEGEAADIFRNALTFLPYTLFEVHEIIPLEKAKNHIGSHESYAQNGKRVNTLKQRALVRIYFLY